METSIETRILKVGDLVFVKEDQILYEGSRFEALFILLTIDLNKTQGHCIGLKYVVAKAIKLRPTSNTVIVRLPESEPGNGRL